MHSWLFRNRHRLMRLYGISQDEPARLGMGAGSWDGDQRRNEEAASIPKRWPAVERRGTGEVILFPAAQLRARAIRKGA